MVRKGLPEYRWDEVEVLPYKEDGTHFKSITRQTLFRGTDDLNVEFRYFEIGAGGHSTLERHCHQHAVMILRGSGEVLVGETVTPIGERDVVHIPPLTWHQFRATNGEPLGFLCVVSNDRDRPQRPENGDVSDLAEAVRAFVRT